MANLFQKIRQGLIKQNMFKKYLLYAAGEIILVVLGILIALKINSNNADQVNRKMEMNYLQAIGDNLSEDIKDLQFRLQKDSLHLDAYTELIKAFTTDSVKLDEPRMKYLIHNSAVINYFNPQNTVFEEMKSSGNLHLIKTPSLRYAVMNYYITSNKVVTSQEINNNYILEHKSKSIDKYLDMNSLIETKLPEQWNAEINPFDHSFFDKNISDPDIQDFAKNISLMKAATWINHNWKKILIKEAEQLKAQIETYVSQKK